MCASRQHNSELFSLPECESYIVFVDLYVLVCVEMSGYPALAHVDRQTHLLAQMGDRGRGEGRNLFNRMRNIHAPPDRAEQIHQEL